MILCSSRFWCLIYRNEVLRRQIFVENYSSVDMKGPRPIVVSGPSGCGKSTILKRLFHDYPDNLAFSVSHTTRKPRPGEADGVDYHYTERSKMETMIANNEFLENAEFGGNIYGTSKAAVECVQQTGRICILDLEIQGVRAMKKTSFDPLCVFVRPPSMEVLEKRLRDRQTETEESLQKRLDRARVDMEAVADEVGLFDCEVINDTLDKAYEDFKVAIQPVLAEASTIKNGTS